MRDPIDIFCPDCNQKLFLDYESSMGDWTYLCPGSKGCQYTIEVISDENGEYTWYCYIKKNYILQSYSKLKISNLYSRGQILISIPKYLNFYSSKEEINDFVNKMLNLMAFK